MARPRKLTDASVKNFTKEEIEKRKKEEEALEEFEKIPLSPPSWLNKEAKKEYKRIAPLLNRLPIADLDLMAVSSYCDGVAKYIEASHRVDEEGQVIEELDSQGNPKSKVNPWFTTMIQASNNVRAYAGQLGMTIDSRMRIVVPKEKEEKDPFAEMLNDD